MDEWIRKLCVYTCACTHTHRHTLEQYSAIKYEILPFMTTWMGLKGNTLSEINLRKTNTVWSLFYVKSKTKQNKKNCSQVQRTLRWLPGSRGRGVMDERDQEVKRKKAVNHTQKLLKLTKQGHICIYMAPFSFLQQPQSSRYNCSGEVLRIGNQY